MDGIFLINKLKNWTSFDVCARIRKRFNTKKVGHCGTLDPFAEGLMIVALGHATKIIPFLENADKTYIATLKLGEETDTLDNTGSVVSSNDSKEVDEEQVIEVLNNFVGVIKQIPPMYSALKKDGVPLYLLARDGIEIERKEREVTIHYIKLISYRHPYIEFEAKVSKGTYIRTLGSDIAKKLNTVGHLVSLKRINIDKYSLNDSKDVNEISIEDSYSIRDILSHIDTHVVDDKIEKKIRDGKRLYLQGEDLVLLVNKKQEALAIYEKREDGYYYSKRGLFHENN